MRQQTRTKHSLASEIKDRVQHNGLTPSVTRVSEPAEVLATKPAQASFAKESKKLGKNK